MKTMLAAAAAFAALGGAEALTAASAIKVDGATQTYRDAAGRTRLFHGINYVNKGGDYLPQVTEATADQLKSLGFNVVRLGVMLPGVFPTNSTPDAGYLAKVAAQVDMLWARGIYSVIDLHQDVLGKEICGEGTPDWMWNVTDLGALPFPEPMAFSNTSKPDPATGKYAPKADCSVRGVLKAIGWSGFYMTDACGKAFGQLYTQESIIGKMIEKYWGVVAAAMKGRAGVLFYELLNEPWFGDHVGEPDLLLVSGAAEKKTVGPYMQKMADVVKAADPETPVLYAPAELNNRLMRHVGYEAGFLPGNPMAFHVYCVTGTDGAGPTTWFTKQLCHVNDNFQLDNRRADLARLQTAGFVTEFGAVSDAPTGLAEVKFVSDHMDGDIANGKVPLSWIYWAGIPGQTDYQQLLARSYPHAVAGALTDMAYDTDSKTFRLGYTPAGTAPTTVYLSPLNYPNGYDVAFTPADCCSFAAAATDPNVIEITARAGAEVRVVVTRK